MKRMVLLVITLFLGTFGHPRSCPAPMPASQPASVAAPVGEISELSRIVLADPLDTEAMTRLTELRRLEQQNRRAAFEALIKALQSSIEGNRAATHMAILQVRQVPEVAKLAESILGIPLNELGKSRRDDESSLLCRSCGNTGQADCRHCRGTGIVYCSTCKGRGFQRNRDRVHEPAAPSIVPCPDCDALGAVVCPHCAGRGTVYCRTCTRESETRDADVLFDEPMLEKVRELVALARYLRDGGVDLFSRDALTCAPRMVH